MHSSLRAHGAYLDTALFLRSHSSLSVPETELCQPSRPFTISTVHQQTCSDTRSASTMTNWHDPSCRHLDAVCVGSILSCLSCGSVGDIESVVDSVPEPPRTSDPSKPRKMIRHRHLFWPTSVKYSSAFNAEISNEAWMAQFLLSRVTAVSRFDTISSSNHEYRLEAGHYQSS